jgi:hypothetical protein
MRRQLLQGRIAIPETLEGGQTWLSFLCKRCPGGVSDLHSNLHRNGGAFVGGVRGARLQAGYPWREEAASSVSAQP